MHLRQPEFTKNKKQMKRFKETGDWGYIYQNKLG